MVNKPLSNVMPTYGNKTLEFVKGKGCYLYTSQNKKYSNGFGPMLKGFKQIEFNNEKKLISAINKKTAGIMTVSYTHLTLPTTPYV